MSWACTAHSAVAPKSRRTCWPSMVEARPARTRGRRCGKSFQPQARRSCRGRAAPRHPVVPAIPEPLGPSGKHRQRVGGADVLVGSPQHALGPAHLVGLERAPGKIPGARARPPQDAGSWPPISGSPQVSVSAAATDRRRSSARWRLRLERGAAATAESPSWRASLTGTTSDHRGAASRSISGIRRRRAPSASPRLPPRCSPAARSAGSASPQSLERPREGPQTGRSCRDSTGVEVERRRRRR